jgi:hypothetical protein
LLGCSSTGAGPAPRFFPALWRLLAAACVESFGDGTIPRFRQRKKILRPRFFS